MNHITVGVAGHVDHGKTALVRVLTGIDTDRLKEEKERGLSIVLGFAYLDFPAGQIDLIDVPGHEGFIKTMIAGATGMEAVLLVIAADEGPMPQTLEHLEISELVGVKRGVIVISKSDLIPPEKRDPFSDQIRQWVEGTMLESAPIIFTSARSAEGLTRLKEVLHQWLLEGRKLKDLGSFYLPVDRMFSIAGFGTVVTGTLRRGTIRTADPVEIMPQALRAEVRGLQIHGATAEQVEPGRRVAVNLRGIKKDQLKHGDILMTPGSLRSTLLLDAELKLLQRNVKTLKNGQRVRLHFGTTETAARVRLLDRDELHGGELSLVQFRCKQGVVVPYHDHYIVRTFTPSRTIGGGRVLDPHPQQHRRFDQRVIQLLQALGTGKPDEVLPAKLLEAEYAGYSLEDMIREFGMAPEQLETQLKNLPLVLFDSGIALHRQFYEALQKDVVARLELFHQQRSTETGMPKETLRSKLPEKLRPTVFHDLIAAMVKANRVEVQNGMVKLTGFDAIQALSSQDRQIAQEIESAFQRGGFSPPNPDEVIGQDEQREKIYRFLTQRQVLVPTIDRSRQKTVVFHRDAIPEAKKILNANFAESQEFAVHDAGRALNTSRKYIIPLLEHLDAQGFTQRSGNERTIVERDDAPV